MITKTELRKKILREVALMHGVTLDELRGKRRTPELVAARVDAAQKLTVAGFSSTRIGLLLRRDRTVIAYYLKSGTSVTRRLRNMPVAVKSLQQAARQAMIEIAECEQIPLATLVKEWLTERALYEIDAKRRAKCEDNQHWKKRVVVTESSMVAA